MVVVTNAVVIIQMLTINTGCKLLLIICNVFTSFTLSSPASQLLVALALQV